MYLHIGNHRNLRIRDVIGIFDADTATVSAITKKYLSRAEERREVSFASAEVPKSFVLYRVGKKYRICFSALSSASLYGRVRESDFNEIYRE